MSVNIKSGVRASVSHESSLTTPPLTYSDPFTVLAPSGSIPISQIIGLQAVLDSKLNDVSAPVGVTNVFASGNDLNLLGGTFAYGLTTPDLQKLADINATAVEVNYLVGVTNPIQAQIDASYSDADFTTTDQVILGTGAGTGSVELLADVLNGTVGIGYEFADLRPATVDIDFNNQFGINALDPVNPQDVATKNYVDTQITSGSAFLPLVGGVMAGNLDLDGNQLILDVDGDTILESSADDVVQLTLGTGEVFVWDSNGVDAGGLSVINVLDPVNAQDAATKNYTDVTFLPYTGGVMTGTIDMNGFDIILDADGDTALRLGVNDEVTIDLGGVSSVVFGTDINTGGLDVSNLPATPVTPLSAITTTFADTAYLRLDGANTMGADLDMGGFTIDNVAVPTAGDQIGDRDYNDARYLQIGNNLSDVANMATVITNLGLATVATSGDYNDLINTPTFSINNLDDLGDVVTGTPGATQDGYVLQWNNGASIFDLAPAPVVSVFGRTGSVVSAAGDYNAVQVDFAPAGSIVAINTQQAVEEVDNNKLARDGSQTMLGNLDMNNNQIVNIATPFVVGNFETGTTEFGANTGGNSFQIKSDAVSSSANPTYSFNSATDSGIYWDGTHVVTSVGGNDAMRVGTVEVDVDNRQVKNVATPTDNGDAVNLAYVNSMGMERVLGQTSGIDLVAATAGSGNVLYIVPAGVRHIITKVILVATSYNPGITPADPIISVGTSGPNYNQIVDTTSLSWGGIAGAADQAVYTSAKNGADTPNAANTITMRVDTPAGGSFASLVVDVYVLGIEL